MRRSVGCRFVPRSRFPRNLWAGVVSWFLVGVCGAVVPLAAQEALATSDQRSVPATGRHAVDVEIAAFGRYAVFAESERGASVQLVDRAAGPGVEVGVPGEQDGRVDAFLDRGDVRVIVRGVEGEVADTEATQVRIEPFREIGSEAVRLGELAFVETSLGDFESRSWWIEIDSSRRVVLESAGRHLSDLRLWRDGTWLVGVEPLVDVVEPVEGQPLRRCRLTTVLNRGLYRLVAYGGVGVPWAIDDEGPGGESGGDSGARPLYLRSGLPRLGEAGRQQIEISPFGEDVFLVPGTATFFRLEAGVDGPAGESVRMTIDDHAEESPFAGRQTQTVSILEETNPPVVEIDRGLDVGQLRRVGIRGRAGESVVLHHFLTRSVYHFSESGEYWLSTISSGSPGDELDTTAILIRNQDQQRHQPAMQVRAVDLVDGLEWRRRVNLLGTTTLYLRVVDPGTYTIRSSGEAQLDLRLEPFAIPGTRPSTYRPPDFLADEGEWDLDAGIYQLTLEPRRQGIGELWIRDPAPPAGLPPRPAPPVRADVRFGVLSLDHSDSYTLYVNQRPGVRTGIVLRRAPLDLAEPLPLVLDGGEAVTLRGRDGWGELVVRAEDGETTTIEPQADGSLRIALPDGVDGPAAVSVARISPAWRGQLPTLPNERFDRLPKWPTLAADEPARLDLGRGRRATYHVRADAPGLYRLESTGLLDTRGTVRTRTIPVLESRDDGGTGRNFSIGRYFAPGDYQLSVDAVGRSTGRLGLRLARTAVRDGGQLVEGTPARGWLDAGEAVAYTFVVEEAGRFRWRSLGLGEVFRVRLEDIDGWPLVTPGVEGDVVRRLEPGSYRWIVLPRSVRARQVTLVERLPEPVERVGHGPFDLPLDVDVTHRWREPTDGAERAPDVWRFELSAPATVTAALSVEMEATLRRLDGSEAVVGELAPRRPFSGRLDAGTYALHVRAARLDDRRDYRLRVAVAELLPGTTRDVTVPSSIAMSIGDEGLYEITTLGDLDPRATLIDVDGRTIARADDRPGDWNVRLARRLDPGDYRLGLEGVDATGTVRVGLRRLDEVVAPRLDLQAGDVAEQTFTLGDGARVVPVLVPQTADALLVSARSAENLRLVAEVGGEVGRRTAGGRDGQAPTLLVAVDRTTGEVALRVESLDAAGQPVTLRVLAVDLEARAEASAARLRSRPPTGFDITPVVVDLDRAGCFHVDGAVVATTSGQVAEPVSAAISAPRRLWLAVSESGARLERAIVPDDGTLRLAVTPGDTAACDLGPLPAAAATDGLVGKRLVLARGLGAPAAVAPSSGDPAAWWKGDEDLDPSGAEWFAARAVADDASGFFSASSMAVVRVDADEASGPIEVDLWARSQPAIDRAALAYGASTLQVGPAGAIRVDLPDDRSLRLTLDLSAGAMAAFADRTIWAADRAQRVRLDTYGGFFLIDTTDAGAHASVEVLPTPERGSWSLAVARPLEWRATTMGTLDIRSTSLHGSILKLGVDSLQIAGRDGSLGRGVDAVDQGRLIVEHDAGPVVVWPYDPSDPLRGFWPAETPPAERLELPTAIALGDSGRIFEITTETPRILHLRLPSAGLIGVERPGLPPQLDGALDRLTLDLPLPPGTTRILLRGIAGATVVGLLEAWTDEAEALGEGLGPETLLGPGEVRSYAVTVPAGEPRRIGFGVAAEADQVDGRVLDAAGRELGRGLLQWHELDPGTYLYVLEARRDGDPVRVRPAIVGLDRPSTGPPPEVAEEFLRRAMAGGASR